MAISLAELMFKGYRRRVLALMLQQPVKRYHVREIARLTGTVAGTLHKELSKLADAGVLLKEKIGNQLFYEANVDCLIYEELSSMLLKLAQQDAIKDEGPQMKMDELVEKNRGQILALAKQNGVHNVRVFGSMARNEAGLDSDLDLLVDIDKGKSGLALGGFLSDVTKVVHRKVDVVTEKSLHPKIREKVLLEARPL